MTFHDTFADAIDNAYALAIESYDDESNDREYDAMRGYFDDDDDVDSTLLAYAYVIEHALTAMHAHIEANDMNVNALHHVIGSIVDNARDIARDE